MILFDTFNCSMYNQNSYSGAQLDSTQIWGFLDIPSRWIFSYPQGFPDFHCLGEYNQSDIFYVILWLVSKYLWSRINLKIICWLEMLNIYIYLENCLWLHAFWISLKLYQAKLKKPFRHVTVQMLLWVYGEIVWVLLLWRGFQCGRER